MIKRLLLTSFVLATVTVGLAQTTSSSLADVRELREAARAAYPTAFVDLPLWMATIEAAEAAVTANPANAEAVRLLADIYTETHWAVRAWEVWNDYLELTGEWRERSVSMVAREMAFYAKQRDDAQAVTYWQRQARRIEP